jgi:predicted outer membrane repeat protein
MFFFSWLRKRNSNPRAKRATAARPKQARFRPLLEALEDRAVPSTLNVTTTLDELNPNDGVLSLREAVMQTNNSTTPVTIAVPAGRYALQLGPLVVSGASVTIQGTGAGATIIDGGGSGPDFETTLLNPFPAVVSGVTFSGLTIQGGTAAFGGGIYSVGTDLTVDHCTISGNSASAWGGGIFAQGAKITLLSSLIQGNSAGDEGGGIYKEGPMKIADSVIANNSSPTGAGGGIYDGGFDLTLMKSTVAGNSAIAGGGIFNNADHATLTVQGCTFFANSALGPGGGIANHNGTLTVTNTTFSCNTATGGTTPGGAGAFGQGGAIFNEATLDVRGSTFTGNFAGDFGGAIYNLDTATIQQCTLSGNSAGSGGGIYNAGAATVQQSTLSGNTAASTGGGIYDAASGTLAVKDSTVLNNLAPFGADIHNLGALTLDDSIVGDLYQA